MNMEPSAGKQKLVVLSGAGVSAESGLRTFRDADGLWENHRIEDVATPQAFARNPALVLEFYNQRRRQLGTVQPNAAHRLIAGLEAFYDVQVITQNVDDLHERAGSSRVLHLHGELTRARSTRNPDHVLYIGYADLTPGQLCPQGGQLRPHIVWFGEQVPAMDEATGHCASADLMLIIGTSLQVYPAAGLVHCLPPGLPLYVIDPRPGGLLPRENLTFLKTTATAGMEQLYALLTAGQQATFP